MEQYGKYGFYESVDFTKSRLKKDEKFSLVKTYMAHHQGLILTSINNIVNRKILNKRFFENPEIESADILLQERMPDSIMISKNSNERLKKQKYVNVFYDKSRIYRKNEYFKRINVTSSDDYTILIDNLGREKSIYKDIQINRSFDQEGDFYKNGFFIRNVKNNKVWTTFDFGDNENCEVKFSNSENSFSREDEGIETNFKVIPSSNNSAEIRRLTLKNFSSKNVTLEVCHYMEAIFSKLEQDIAHPIFNNMFLKLEYLEDEELMLIRRDDRNEENSKYVYAMKLYVDSKNKSTKTNFEVDKKRFWGRNNFSIPQMINKSYMYENKVKDIVEGIIALEKKVNLKSEEEINIDFILGISESKDELLSIMKEYENEEKRNAEFKLFKSKSEEEIKYLRLNGDMIETFQILLGHVLNKDLPLKEKVLESVYKKEYVINDLWKFGISGDNPIITLRIKNIDDIEVIDEILKCFEFFKNKNINIDLCIINGEENSYELVLKDLILKSIRDAQLEYLINIKIFILDEYMLDKKDLELIYAKSNLNIDIKYGNLKLNIQDMENKAIKKVKAKIEKADDDLFIDLRYKKELKLLDMENRSYSDIINNSLVFFNRNRWV